MPSLDRRVREKAAVQEKILNAARDLFVREGYEAVSLRRIAEAIEYTAPAIYTHFKDKDDLLRTLCRQDFLALNQGLQTVRSIRDPLRRIAALGEGYIAFAVAHPQHYRLMFMTPHPPHIEPEAEDLATMNNPDADGYAALREACAEAIAGGTVRAEYRDAELMAQLFWACVHGVVSLQITHEHDPWITWTALEMRTRRVIEMSIRGMLTPEAAREWAL